MMQNKIADKAFGSIFVGPNAATVLQVVPPRSPFFAPKRVQISCLHAEDPTQEMDLKIGSVTIGDCPQLAINTLTPDAKSQGIRPEDLHRQDVNWSVLSTVGLCRDLQMSIYNPNNDPVAVFVSLDGFDIQDEYDSACRSARPGGVDSGWDMVDPLRPAGDPLDRTCESENGVIYRRISGNDMELDPFEHGVIRFAPTVSPFFEPRKIRFHGRGCDSGQSIPFVVLNAYCGDRLLYNARSVIPLLSEGDGLQNFSATMKSLGGRWLEALVRELCDNGSLAEWGASVDSELKRIRSKKRGRIPGMLSSHIADGADGWGAISWWPTISTRSLSRDAGIIVYNPWPFRIRVNATLAGNSSHDNGAAIKESPTRSDIEEIVSATATPTWTEIAAIASAVDRLISGADISHDLLVELASPLLRRLEFMHAQILLDPHGDSDLAAESQSFKKG